MSDTYDTTVSSGEGVAQNSPGTLDTAKHEASQLKDTATDQAKNVLGTVKSEASSVVGEAKYQAKDLFAQTQRELRDQADTQQRRVAGGLRSVSDDLDALASGNADGATSGMAADLMRQVSGRLSGAAQWLGDRDASELLQEVKLYARRKPGTFILGAAVLGVVAGRLTRALASNASDEKAADNAATRRQDAWAPVDGTATVGTDTGYGASVGGTDAAYGAGFGGAGTVPPVGTAPVGSAADGGLEETPIYSQSASSGGDTLGTEGGHDRSDSL